MYYCDTLIILIIWCQFIWNEDISQHNYNIAIYFSEYTPHFRRMLYICGLMLKVLKVLVFINYPLYIQRYYPNIFFFNWCQRSIPKHFWDGGKRGTVEVRWDEEKQTMTTILYLAPAPSVRPIWKKSIGH